MFLSKKAITVLLGILVFLLPISIGINDIESIQSGEQIVSITENTAYAINLNCDTGFFGASGIGCQLSEGLLSFYELIIFYFTQIVVVLIGVMLDIFIFLSIDSQFYRSGLIEAGWEILRDFTNIVFIFALLVVAFKMVLGSDDGGTKKTLVKTILIALIINFSLFMTYAIIDGSNILAHTLYNKIDATANTYNTAATNTNADTTQIANDTEGLGSGESSLSSLAQSIIPQDSKNLSIAIAGKINPQQIVNASGSGALQAFIIITGAGILNILLIWLFISMILVFVGRAIGLMVSAILAPVAFASIVVPSLQNKSYIGFNKWLPELISLAFLAPVYMFFLYLVISFLGNEGFLASIQPGPGEGILESILKAYIPFIIVGGLLFLTKKISTSMAGELGSMATRSIQGVTGALVAGAAIAATGGAAAVGTGLRVGGAAAQGVGQGAKYLSKGKYGKGLSTIGSAVKEHGKYLQATRIDPTRNKVLKSIMGDDAAKYAGKVTGKSLLGHIEGDGKSLLGSMGGGNEYADLQAAKVKRVQEEAQTEIKENKTAADWQREVEESKQKVKDTNANSEIKTEESKLAKQKLDSDIDDKERTLEQFAKDIRKEMSQSVVVNVSAEPTVNMQIDGAPLPPSMGGGNVANIPAGSSRAQFEDKAIKAYDKDIKDKQKEIKQEERIFAKANAEGNTALASYAQANITALEDGLSDLEKDKKDFEKQTAKKQVERLKNIEKDNHNIAREKVAKDYETKDEKTAQRIREGKVGAKPQEADKK